MQLQGRSREKDEGHGIAAALPQGFSKIQKRTVHFALIKVAESENLEAERLQRIGHYPPVVCGARGTMRRLVCGVTDDERYFFARLLREAGAGPQQKRQTDKKPGNRHLNPSRVAVPHSCNLPPHLKKSAIMLHTIAHTLSQ